MPPSSAPHAVDITFIIPAFNEEQHIGATLDRIRHFMPMLGHQFELLVADNGSSDATPLIARAEGATVLVQAGGTIGSLRNLAARHAAGRYLVFLDADVHITQGWVDNLPGVLDHLSAQPRTLAGSICGIPEHASWIERYWFDPRQRNHRITHIGSGHLLTTRAFFEELGGFSETMRTGEDYELSARAIAVGGGIVDAPALSVEHLGYPSSLRTFVRREMWHGESDFISWSSLVHSKVALLTVLFSAAHIALLAGVLLERFRAAYFCLALIALLCLVSAFVKYKGRPPATVLINSVLYYFYFAGRAAALFKALAGRLSRRIATSSARNATRRSGSRP